MEINKIYNENCIDTMARMPANFIDLTVTSPPYDNLRDYKGYTFDFESIAKELFRVTKDGGVVVWIVGDATVNGSETGTSFRQALFFMDCGFGLYDTMIYEKIGNPTPQKPEIRYMQCFEYMFVFCKGVRPSSINLIRARNKIVNGKHMATKMQRNGTVLKYKFNRNEDSVLKNVWLIDAANGCRESKGHAAPFPEKLAKNQISTWSDKGHLVYDPFMGSGTTAKMAHLLKRNWIGSEISEEYTKLANKRIKPYLDQLSIF